MGGMVSDAFTWIIDTGAEALTAIGVDEALAEAITEAAVEAAVTAAVSVAVNALVSPALGVEGRPTQVSWSPDSGMPYLTGYRASAGLRVMIDEYGADNRFLSDVRVLSGYGPAHSIGTTYLNKQSVSFKSDGAANGGPYNERFWRTTQLGQDTEAGHLTQTGLYQSAQMQNWTAQHKLSGKAAAIYTAARNSKRDFYNRFPDVLQEGQFGLFYDPRLDDTHPGGSGAHRWGDKSTYSYSTNGAIQALNYALGLRENGQIVEGFGVDLEEVDVDGFVEAANVADLNGWTCHGAWSSKDNPREVFTAMLQAAGARIAFKGGRLSCVSIGAQRVSLATITSADTAGPVSLKAFGSRLGRKNTATPKCVLKSHDWEMVDLDPVTSETWRQEDAGPDGQPETRQLSIEFPFVTDAEQATQLAAYALANSRESMALTIPLKPYHMDLEVGDCITISEPAFNVDGIKVQVLERPIDTGTGVMVLQVISETDGKHPFALGLTTVAPTAPVLVEDNTYERVDPPQGDWNPPTPGTVTNPVTGGSVPVLIIDGNVESPRVQWVRLEYRYRMPDGQGGWGPWSEWSPAQEVRADIARFEIFGIPPGAQVESRISYITDFNGVSENPLVLDPVTVGSLVAENVAAVGERAAQAINDALDEAAALNAEIAAAIPLVDLGASSLDEALDNRLRLIDQTASSTAGDLRVNIRNVQRAEAGVERALDAVRVLDEKTSLVELDLGDRTASIEQRATILQGDVDALSLQVSFWTNVNVNNGDLEAAVSALTQSIVDGDSAQAGDITTAQATADSAKAIAESVRDLTVSSGTALAQRFAGLDAVVGTLSASYQNIVDLQNIDGTPLASLLESLSAERDPDTPGSLRAQIEELKEVQATEEAARVRQELRANAQAEASQFALSQLLEATAVDRGLTVQELERIDLLVGENALSFAQLLNLELDETSLLYQFVTATQADLDPSNELSLAGKVEDHETIIFDASEGVLQRLDLIEGTLTPAEGPSLTAQIAEVAEAILTLDAATARSERRFLAETEAIRSAIVLERSARAEESAGQILLVEQAILTGEENEQRWQSVINLDFDGPNLLASTLETLAQSTQANASSIEETRDIISSNEAARLRQSLRLAAEAEQALAAAEAVRLASLDEQGGLVASIERVELDLGGYKASAEQTFLAKADFDSTLAAYEVSVNGAQRTLADHLLHIEGTADGTAQNLADNYLNTAAANQLFMTATEVDGVLATFDLSLNSTFAGLAGDVGDIELQLPSFASQAYVDQTFTTAADVDQAITAADLSLNATFNGLEQRVGSAETGLSDRYTIADVDQFVQALASADSAISLSVTNLSATVNGVSSSVAVNAQAISDVQGNLSSTYGFTLIAGNRIGGMQALATGQQTSINFAFDFFVIEGQERFEYDSETGLIKAKGIVLDWADIQNVQISWAQIQTIIANNLVVGEAQIENASVTSIKMASGALGAVALATPIASYDWYIGDGTNQTDYGRIGIETPFVNIKPGAYVRALLSYTVKAEEGAYEWLYWKDQVDFRVERSDGGSSTVFPQYNSRVRNKGFASNTGGGVGGFLHPIYYDVEHEVTLIIPPTGSPWHSGAAFPARLKAVADIDAYSPPGANGRCAWPDAPFGNARWENTQMLNVNLRIEAFEPGPFIATE